MSAHELGATCPACGDLCDWGQTYCHCGKALIQNPPRQRVGRGDVNELLDDLMRSIEPVTEA